MTKLLAYPDIDPQQWNELVHSSPTATWFQTKEAYEFYAAVSGMQAFAYGVAEEGRLVGVIVGFTTQSTNAIQQYFTKRAIIYGGPLLANCISETALAELLKAVAQCPASRLIASSSHRLASDSNHASTPYPLHSTPIYIETRNFHDYSRWKEVFKRAGFNYQKHLDYHINTTSIELAQRNIGKHRWRYIRLSMRDGAKIVDTPTIEQVRAFYTILQDLYRTKVRTPLWSWEFFARL